MPARRQTDASKLNFPLQLVIVIVGTVMAASGAVWTIEAGLRSEVRNIGTVMEEKAKADAIQRELDRERVARAGEKQQAQSDALKATIDTMERNQQLLKIEFQQFKESMLQMNNRRP